MSERAKSDISDIHAKDSKCLDALIVWFMTLPFSKIHDMEGNFGGKIEQTRHSG